MSAEKENPYRRFCQLRGASHQLRRLQETRILPEGYALRAGEKLINFASNDYLGLSQHPLLVARSQEFALRYGAGSTASRLISGNMPAYKALEERLARGKGSEAALIMNSGYQANLTVLAALADAEVAGKPVTVIADRLCHNSLLQGVLLSGARLVRFRHNDYDHLAGLLRSQAGKGAYIIVISESVFGMDGDRADLEQLTLLSRRYDAMLYVDEAHATGVFGPDGFGLCAGYKGAIDVVMGTFGKALGSFGAYIASSAVLRDYLVQRCGGLIYSTALPPPVLGALEAALELLPQLQNERDYLQSQAARLRAALTKQGWNCGMSDTHIIPVILGEEQSAAMLSGALYAQGIYAPAIRPPTVPRGTSRLRLSLSAAHKMEDIDRLSAAMAGQASHFAAPESLAS